MENLEIRVKTVESTMTSLLTRIVTGFEKIMENFDQVNEKIELGFKKVDEQFKRIDGQLKKVNEQLKHVDLQCIEILNDWPDRKEPLNKLVISSNVYLNEPFYIIAVFVSKNKLNCLLSLFTWRIKSAGLRS